MNTHSTGTRERKRAAKAMPPRLEAESPGCLVVILVYSSICAFLFWQTRWWTWVALGVPAAIALVVVITRELRGRTLLAECRRAFAPRGVHFLVVHSDSPVWNAHIRDRWLPRFGQTAVLLNWTDRARWKRSLEVRLFNHFIKSPRNFTPAVLVLRGSERPLVFRFFYAFQQAQHGRIEYLNKLEAELFTFLPGSPKVD